MRWSLEGKVVALLLAVLLFSAAVSAAIEKFSGSIALASLSVLVVALLPLLWISKRIVRPLRRLLRAMSSAVASYRDGDFSFSLVVDRRDELGTLLTAHNELGRALREHRAELAQRELLLETVTQNSPVATVLVDTLRRVVYANLAAGQLLNEGRSLVGESFALVLQRAPEPLRLAASAGEDCLFSIQIGGAEQTFHVSHRSFSLRGQPHELYLLKCLTRELSRQEVSTWKKVIRVLSHELNNSLAPITSLAHSGVDITQGAHAELTEIFAAIGERAEHLHRFILGYATFSKLPAPRAQWVGWPSLMEEIIYQQPCRLVGDLPAQPGWFDPSQIGQALINLLKNAHESGGPSDAVEMTIAANAIEHRVEIRDRGPGMSEVVMSQALLPFYSTKRNGTGLGLVLVREIAEAHGGHIQLSNRAGGGLCVTLILPLPSQSPSVYPHVA